ncbi:MAG: hypothetical protein AMXMBFR48_08940 [Ignavibacteriales bacterium]
MDRNEKQLVIDEVAELINKSMAVYCVDYAGVGVGDISKLRDEFRKEGIVYKVVKNTFFSRAVDQTGKYAELKGSLPGMSGFAFAFDNPGAPAKVIKKYFDDKKKFTLKGACIDAQYFPGSSLNELASLPSKPEVIASILSSLNAPASGIVGSIHAVIRELVSVIDEIEKKKAA